MSADVNCSKLNMLAADHHVLMTSLYKSIDTPNTPILSEPSAANTLKFCGADEGYSRFQKNQYRLTAGWLFSSGVNPNIRKAHT